MHPSFVDVHHMVEVAGMALAQDCVLPSGIVLASGDNGCLTPDSGNACQFACQDAGAKLTVGPQSALCKTLPSGAIDFDYVENGGPTPECHVPCSQIPLAAQTSVDNPRCQEEQVPHGTVCTYSCDAGFTFGGSKVAAGSAAPTAALTCSEGAWSAQLLPCLDEDGCAEHLCKASSSRCVDNKVPCIDAHDQGCFLTNILNSFFGGNPHLFFQPPALGAQCECLEGFFGDANSGGVSDGDGCQKLRLKAMLDETQCRLVLEAPYGDDCDVQFRFGGSRLARVISVNDLFAETAQLQTDGAALRVSLETLQNTTGTVTDEQTEIRARMARQESSLSRAISDGDASVTAYVDLVAATKTAVTVLVNSVTAAYSTADRSVTTAFSTADASINTRLLSVLTSAQVSSSIASVSTSLNTATTNLGAADTSINTRLASISTSAAVSTSVSTALSTAASQTTSVSASFATSDASINVRMASLVTSATVSTTASSITAAYVAADATLSGTISASTSSINVRLSAAAVSAAVSTSISSLSVATSISVSLAQSNVVAGDSIINSNLARSYLTSAAVSTSIATTATTTSTAASTTTSTAIRAAIAPYLPGGLGAVSTQISNLIFEDVKSESGPAGKTLLVTINLGDWMDSTFGAHKSDKNT